MTKDPAILFYTSDFLTGTMTMTDEQVGKYIRLLCLQHQKGHLSKNDMIFICKSPDDYIFSKFIQDKQGLYFNQRIEIEITRRKMYSKSRSDNKLGKKGGGKKVITYEKDMKIISKSYDNHMENENINENINNKKFIIPDISEIQKYLEEEKGIKTEISLLIAENFFNFYDSKGWKVGRESMKKWKPALTNSLKWERNINLTNNISKNEEQSKREFYNKEIETALKYPEVNPESKQYSIDYCNFVLWIYCDGRYLKKDILGNEIKQPKTNLLKLKKQLSFIEFIELKNKCMNKINIIDIFNEMENYSGLIKRTVFKDTAEIFINNKIERNGK